MRITYFFLTARDISDFSKGEKLIDILDRFGLKIDRKELQEIAKEFLGVE